ncbi:hypothetical protein BX600DRAFT_472707 [Xylariales sp. PMI_506]|nr:hypothetical protein BX600DRAFT_472707 [Xylariales sp. PMI_506]
MMTHLALPLSRGRFLFTCPSPRPSSYAQFWNSSQLIRPMGYSTHSDPPSHVPPRNAGHPPQK